MSSSSFNVIRRHSLDATNVRIKELTQELARQRSDIAGSQLETDDVRSQGRMDHSTIKLNDERLKFITTLNAASTDFFYEFPTEPDFNNLKVWFMLDHLGARMRDMSGLGNDAYIAGHPTLRRAGLDLGFQQTSAGGGTSATPVMLFNSGTDVVSQNNGEYIWIPDNPSIQFTQFTTGFTITFRFNCLDFNAHIHPEFGSFGRRFASKSDNATNGWNLIVYPTNVEGTQGGVEFQIVHDNITYKRRTTGYLSNTWYQVVITYNPAAATADQRIKIYTAGTENSVTGITTLTLPPSTNLRIGARSSDSGFFYGYIHDFRLYMDKVLTQTEITNINQNEMTIDNITKGHVFVVQYAMVSQAMRSRTHKYNIGGSIERDRIHKFNVTSKITRTRTHKYNVLDDIARTRTHKFNLLNATTRIRTHKYHMEGVITVTRTHKYNLNGVVTTTKTHKYNIGGLQTQYLRFQKSTTTGSNITQDITFNGKPQALIVWSNGSIVDNTQEDDLALYYGFSNGVNHACVSGLSKDALTTTDTFSGHKTDKVISLMTTTVGSMTSEATVSFIDTNTARFTWTTNDNRAVYIHCLAIWGVNNADVVSHTVGTSATGNRTYALNNTGMTPTFIHTISNMSPADWSTAYGISISMGAATSASKQFSVGMVSVDAQATTDTASYYDTTNCIVGLDDDSTTVVESTATLVSFAQGQFTVNWTDAPVSTKVFSALVLDSPNIDVGTFTQPSVTGNQTVNTATTVNAVKGLMLFNNRKDTSGLTAVGAMSIGGGSGTGAGQNGVISVVETDAAADSNCVKYQGVNRVIRTQTGNAVAASSVMSTEATLNALGTDQFTVNWGTVDATLRKVHYIVFGDG